MESQERLPIKRSSRIELLIQESKDIRLRPCMPFARRIKRAKKIQAKMDVLIKELENEIEKTNEYYDLLEERDELGFQVEQLEKQANFLAKGERNV